MPPAPAEAGDAEPRAVRRLRRSWPPSRRSRRGRSITCCASGTLATTVGDDLLDVGHLATRRRLGGRKAKLRRDRAVAALGRGAPADVVLDVLVHAEDLLHDESRPGRGSLARRHGAVGGSSPLGGRDLDLAAAVRPRSRRSRPTALRGARRDRGGEAGGERGQDELAARDAFGVRSAGVSVHRLALLFRFFR